MLKGKDLLSIHDLSVAEVEEILSLAKELKAMQKAGVSCVPGSAGALGDDIAENKRISLSIRALLEQPDEDAE